MSDRHTGVRIVNRDPDRARKRAPSDARCAWRKMTSTQRHEFRMWALAESRPTIDAAVLAAAPDGEILSPCCEDDLYLLETMGARRGPVEPCEDANTIVCDGYYTTEGFDESAEDTRLMCGDCCREYNLPPGTDIEWR